MKTKATALLTALLVSIGIFAAGPAFALTWTNLGNVKDFAYFDSCDGDVGYISMEVQWHVSDDYRLRVGAAHDIVIVNDSNNRIRITQGTSGGSGGLAYERTNPGANPFISAYRNGSGYFYIPDHHTSVLSADNPDRWVRTDGVSDSDPSPYNTYIQDTSDPTIELVGFPEVYIQGGWHTCGSQPIVLETKNNAA